MKPNIISNTISRNEHVAQKLFDILQHATLAAGFDVESSYTYLRRVRNQYRGQVRKELDRIVALGEKGTAIFCDMFLKEFGA